MRKDLNTKINHHLFNEIDTILLSGIKCSAGNQVQQDYFERLRFQTENAFINKRLEKY